MFKETPKSKELYNGVFHGGSVNALGACKRKHAGPRSEKKSLPMLASMINPLAQSPTEIMDKLDC